MPSPPLSGVRARRAFDRLVGAGSRRTLARQLVLDVLDEDGGHLPAADIHAQVATHSPAVTLSTVYRTLATLTDHHLVHTFAVGGEAHYGLADDPHHHAICTGCGTATEIPAESVTDLIPRLQHAAGLTIDAGGITLTGLCPHCTI